ncbi:MAG: hypothetical protein V4642_11665 [Bacteroidota bacterium]
MNLDATLFKAILAQVASAPENTRHDFTFPGVDAQAISEHVEFLIKEHLLTGYSEADAGGHRWWFVNGITHKGSEHLRKM